MTKDDHRLYESYKRQRFKDDHMKKFRNWYLRGGSMELQPEMKKAHKILNSLRKSGVTSHQIAREIGYKADAVRNLMRKRSPLHSMEMARRILLVYSGLKPYHFSFRAAEWSFLVFANNRQEAKVIGWRENPLMECEADYVDARVRRAKPEYRVFAQKNVPHAVDSYDSDVETWEEALQLELNKQSNGSERI